VYRDGGLRRFAPNPPYKCRKVAPERPFVFPEDENVIPESLAGIREGRNIIPMPQIRCIGMALRDCIDQNLINRMARRDSDDEIFITAMIRRLSDANNRSLAALGMTAVGVQETVGWVERSDTHQSKWWMYRDGGLRRFAPNPPYEMRCIYLGYVACSNGAHSRAYEENRPGSRPVTCVMSSVMRLAPSSRK